MSLCILVQDEHYGLFPCNAIEEESSPSFRSRKGAGDKVRKAGVREHAHDEAGLESCLQLRYSV